MALQSMTGFARAVADHDGTSIAWEVKSVNGKSVELRLRLPPGFERLEPALSAVTGESAASAQPVVVLLTDGQSNSGESPLAVVEEFVAAKSRVFVVG